MKEYFYKKNGKLFLYHYCCYCGSGPFKNEQLNEAFFKLGNHETPIIICCACAKIKFPEIIDKELIERQNKSPSDSVIEIGQKWYDLDKRRNRAVDITRIENNRAFYTSKGREFSVSISRLLKKWKLLKNT